ncbi:MAG: hypothetical protein HY585_01440 [Candidatus Omnitrophica bacterium]|nr:hypothetical protein [Candidatus Omnitrophota bacterium]
MKFGKVITVLSALICLLIISTISNAKEEKEFAVPAFSDLAPLTGQNAGRMITPQEELNPLPYVKQNQWLDLNRDLKLNDFDVKQFQSIVESLNGQKLTGLQLAIRFKGEQSNQRESFPLLYDLDRDSMFTSFDVDRFTELVSELDNGADSGNELIQKYRLQIYPRSKLSE